MHGRVRRERENTVWLDRINCAFIVNWGCRHR